MEEYNPKNAPDPEEWLDMDEQERIMIVEQYHEREKVELPNPHLHAIFQVIVENQIAMGLDFVDGTVKRLMHEGLSRHDALHAICCAVGEDMYQMLKGNKAFDQQRYRGKLKRMTKKKWLRMADE